MTARRDCGAHRTSGSKTILVRVRVLDGLKDRFGSSQLRLDIPVGLSAAEAVGSLLLRYPKRAEDPGSPPIIAFLNGRNVDVLTPEEAALEDGDELLLTTPIGGG